MRDELHIHHHIDLESGAISRLDSVLAQLHILQRQGARIMSTADDIKAQQVRQGTALANMANDIRELMGKVTGGISDTEAADISAAGESLAAGMEAVANEYKSAGEP